MTLVQMSDITKPSILEIKISLDGNQWCALVGQNLQEGIAGFADTPLCAIRQLCDELEKTPWNLEHLTLF